MEASISLDKLLQFFHSMRTISVGSVRDRLKKLKRKLKQR